MLWDNWIHYLTLYTKINSSWTKDFKIKNETRKVLEENMGGFKKNMLK